MNLRNTFFGTLLLMFIISCGGNDPFFFEDDFSTVPEAFSVEGITPDTTQTGLIIYEIAAGSGNLEIGIRDDVEIFYTGRTTDEEIFDSSYKNSNDDPLRSSVRSFVDGFTEGLIGMKEGGKRVLVIPPALAYEGTTNALRNDTLVFDIEIDSIIF